MKREELEIKQDKLKKLEEKNVIRRDKLEVRRRRRYVRGMIGRGGQVEGLKAREPEIPEK